MAQVPKKWVMENYSKEDIIKAAPKKAVKKDTVELHDGDTLQEIIEYLGARPEDIKIEAGIWYSDSEFFAYHEYEAELTDDERLEKGIEVLRKREQNRREKEATVERKRKQLEKLKKELEDAS